MGITLKLRKDAAGEPLVSATFVLVRAPAPDERLGPLVERAVLAIDLQAEIASDGGADGADDGGAAAADGGAYGTGAAAVVEDVTFSLLDHGAPGIPAGGGATTDGPAVVASQRVTGPFGHGALSATLAGAAGTALLEALVAGSPRFGLRAVVETKATATPAATIHVRLGGLWKQLDAVADGTRLFTRADLVNYLPSLIAAGAVSADGATAGTGAGQRVLDAVLKAARYVLEPATAGQAAGPAGDGEEPSYHLALQSLGDMDVAMRLGTVQTDGGVQEATVELAGLVNPAIAHDRARFLHLVSSSGGRLDAVLPARTTRAPRGPGGAGGAGLGFIAMGNRIQSVGSALGSNRPAATILVDQPLVTAHPLIHHLQDLELVATIGQQRQGPVANNGSAGIWKDRWSDLHWYAPEYALVLPAPGAAPEGSPFSFEVEPAGGHTLDGSIGITATISVTLKSQKSAPTVAEWEAAGRPELRAVELSGFTVQLGIPFRDEHGATQREQITADSFDVQPGDGGLLTARFRLMDNWARLAYGALSVPGFQAEPATVTVAAGFEGWRLSSGLPPTLIMGLNKTWSLANIAADTRAVPLRLHGTMLANATVLPQWQFDAGVLAQWRLNSFAWSQFATVRTTAISVPCADFGTLYRESTPAGKVSIGCRPALQLGSTEYLTYQEIPVAAAAGRARVYRSLRSPGRFLVVPQRYCVGRYGPASEKAYRPQLLLHSTIDADNPTNIRCVLAASLEPDLPPFARAAIAAELKASAPSPVLEYLPDTGAEPELRWASPSDSTINAVPTATGFDVVVSTDIAGFLVLKSLLERDGLRGSMSAVLPGNVRIASTLEIGLASVAGPFASGPIEVSTRPDGRFDLENHTGQRLAVTALAVAGVAAVPLAAMIEPQGTLAVDGPPGGFDVVFEADQSAERLDEIRAYIEDLDLVVTFVAVDDPAPAALAGWEIQTSMLGRPDAAPVLLNAGIREAERHYVLPLTEFAGDPKLAYTVTAVATNGTRTTAAPVDWPVRSQGVLIPIRLPS
ncbi:hypothetical protein [Arthrobacter sp. 35W]|uniref:hypothetical protein n=1 Tax=Arthrobacter sp. 35W TaxID=1132441 RepID=UPI00041DCE13|nr:hypothetical protein [Arthrobacter sp. 35W]